MRRVLAALLLCLFVAAAGAASAAQSYSTNLTRIGTNLYEGFAGDFIFTTNSCNITATSTPATIRADSNTGFIIGQITFSGGAVCDLTGAYGYYTSLTVGTFNSTLTTLTTGFSGGPAIFIDQTLQLLARSASCFQSVSFQSTTISVFVAGRGYNGGIPLGKINFFSTCDVTGLYGKVGLAGFDLEIFLQGTGSGTITSSPGSAFCKANCIASFAPGEVATLTASPALGSVFAGWGLSCSGFGPCNVTMDSNKTVTAVFTKMTSTIPAKVANISTRGQVLTGGDVMIAGFIIQGDSPQTVVVRARGPSLIPLGVPNALANPLLQLFAGQTQIASNDDWQSAANAAQVTASGFAPSNPLEAAILITLNPGAYTAIVSGVGGGTGVGIVEVFTQ